MRIYHFIYFGLFFLNFLMSQLPVDLNQNLTYTHTINLDSEGEYLMNIMLSSNTSWEEEDYESAVLAVFIYDIYNLDIVIFYGCSCLSDYY